MDGRCLVSEADVKKKRGMRGTRIHRLLCRMPSVSLIMAMGMVVGMGWGVGMASVNFEGAEGPKGSNGAGGAASSREELIVKSIARDAAATVVIYNTNDPEAKGLADFYCEARHIDPSQEIPLATSLSEEISRADFQSQIEEPLQREFVRRGYWKFSIDPLDPDRRPALAATRIGFVALIRGLPLKIAPCAIPVGGAITQPSPYGSCNAASVDSEISLLGLFHHPLNGVIPNPYSVSPVLEPGSAKGGNPSVKKTKGGSFPAASTSFPTSGNRRKSIPPSLLCVARLDATTTDGVRAMVLDGLRVEREGLWGFGYIDLRSIKTGPYGLGDQSIRIAGESMRRAGIPVLSDDLPETIQAGFPVTDAAAYYGWYSGSIDGPFAESSFRFLPGAVACHLHSFSASTLGDPAQGWTGPLVRHGAAASIGNVYEPYIGFTTNFGIFAWSLLAGHNLAESYYAAQPVLSWMTILVGDPLYRPYLGLSGQAGTSHTSPTAPGISETRSREWGKRQFDKWKDYRKIVLAHRGSTLEAASDLAHRARETHESLYLEGLGAAQSDAGQLTKAEASFNAAASLTKDPDTAFRILLERARTFEKEGKPARGAALLSKEISLARSDTQRALLDSWLTRMSKL
jgi:hypothetical protein